MVYWTRFDKLSTKLLFLPVGRVCPSPGPAFGARSFGEVPVVTSSGNPLGKETLAAIHTLIHYSYTTHRYSCSYTLSATNLTPEALRWWIWVAFKPCSLHAIPGNLNASKLGKQIKLPRAIPLIFVASELTQNKTIYRPFVIMCRYIRLNGSQSRDTTNHQHVQNAMYQYILISATSCEHCRVVNVWRPLAPWWPLFLGRLVWNEGIEVSRYRGLAPQHSNSPSCVRIGRQSHAARVGEHVSFTFSLPSHIGRHIDCLLVVCSSRFCCVHILLTACDLKVRTFNSMWCERKLPFFFFRKRWHHRKM